MGAGHADPAPAEPSMNAPEQILVVRLAAIGDVANASALSERIRAERPGAHVTWMCGRVAAPLVTLLGVDEIIVVDERAILRGGPLARARGLAAVWRRLLGRRFDLVLLLHPDPRYQALVLPLLGTPTHRLDRSFGRMNPVPGRFLGDEAARLLDGPKSTGPIVGHYPLADVRARLPATSPLPSAAGRRIVLVPGGARNVMRDDPLRRWPVARYADVARSLVAGGDTVVLVGGPDDAWVRPAFAGIPVVDLIGTLSLVETLTVLRDCSAVVVHDTGPLHLARLVRAPMVALFGPTVPRQVMSLDTNTHVLWGGADLACRPCYDGREFAACRNNLCIQEVTVADVIAAIGAAAPAPSPDAAPAARH